MRKTNTIILIVGILIVGFLAEAHSWGWNTFEEEGHRWGTTMAVDWQNTIMPPTLIVSNLEFVDATEIGVWFLGADIHPDEHLMFIKVEGDEHDWRTVPIELNDDGLVLVENPDLFLFAYLIEVTEPILMGVRDRNEDMIVAKFNLSGMIDMLNEIF